MEVSDQLHATSDLPQKNTSGTHCIGGLVDTRAVMDVTKIRKNVLPLSGIEPQFLGYPVRSLVAIPTELS
jgi:hypothetical protein